MASKQEIWAYSQVWGDLIYEIPHYFYLKCSIKYCKCLNPKDIKLMIQEGKDARYLNDQLRYLNKGDILPTWVCNTCGGSTMKIRDLMQDLFDKRQ